MSISALLTPSEKQRFVNQVSPNVTICMACVARLYKVEHWRWVRVSSGVATLQEDSSLRVVSIAFYDIFKNKKIIKTDLFREMGYQECGPQFHSFNGVTGPLGLAFACSKEAHDLFTSVQAKLIPSSFETKKILRFVKWVKQNSHRFAGNEKEAVNFEMNEFRHSEHIGMDSDGKGFKVEALNQELAMELLDLLRMTARNENDVAAVSKLITSCGTTKAQKALEIHNYLELGQSNQSRPAPLPPPSQQQASDGRSGLLSSITNFDVSQLKQVREGDKGESLPNKGSDVVDSIGMALAQMLANRRMHLNGCDSDEES
ncbi:hypothetical protein TcWFU_007553 [Taenia crassiceps]|uniref:WH1 domain-containing protein n=1 Tax=Taenia crassiceps TaxID=6207 RepID=A0ABR4QSA8_9CEST